MSNDTTPSFETSPSINAAPSGPKEQDIAKSLVCYILAGEYGIFFIWSLVMGIVLLCRPGKLHLRKRQRLQYILILFLSLVRTIQWGIEPFWRTYENADARIEAFLHGLLWSLPAVCLVCTYTMLVSYWVDDWFKQFAPEVDLKYSFWRVVVLIIINFGIFIGQGVVLSLTLLFDKATYQMVQPYYLDAIYSLGVIIFALFGFVVYRRLSKFSIASRSQERIRSTRRVLVTAIIVTVTFVIRIVVNALMPGYIHPWAYKWIFQGIFYTIIELVPILLILWLLLERAPRRGAFRGTETQRLLTTASAYYEYPGSM